VAQEARGDGALAQDALKLAGEVEAALRLYGQVTGPDGQSVWAYEVDGYGNALLMDDANVPGLSSLAYLGCVDRADPVFARTLPCAGASGTPISSVAARAGIGGPHAGLGMIWPMSIIMRAMNSDDDAVIRDCLKTLRATHAGTGFVHEAFSADDAARYTRGWFAWVNGMFGELVLDLVRRRPALMAEPLA
jgi:meiotically up-regulated gene 157 (Mug157) protein